MKETLREVLRPVARTRTGRRAQRRFFQALHLGRAIQTLDRPGWLYGFRGTIPSLDLHFRAARPVTGADIALCERLIEAYALAQAEGPPTSGMWAHEVFQDRQRNLAFALQAGNGEMLAELLASMFRSEFVLGMASGSFGVHKGWRMVDRLWGHLILKKLVALAESQGTARAENPEQGDVGLAFFESVEKLVADTETALGTSLNFPDVGAAYGIEIDGRLISYDSLDQIYGAARIKDAVRRYLPDRDSPLRVVEIGGGFGAMAYWLLQMMDLSYAIVDLPIINVLQGYFLTRAMGEDRVCLYGEEHRRIQILPTHALSDTELPFDVLANKDSMPEIPSGAVLEYLQWARGGCNGIFYSYNQEAGTPVNGEPQNVVPALIAQLGGLERLSRDTSWLRRGYVEEVYRFLQ
jgi:putative sugar O-methyltransferase